MIITCCRSIFLWGIKMIVTCCCTILGGIKMVVTCCCTVFWGRGIKMIVTCCCTKQLNMFLKISGGWAIARPWLWARNRHSNIFKTHLHLHRPIELNRSFTNSMAKVGPVPAPYGGPTREGSDRSSIRPLAADRAFAGHDDGPVSPQGSWICRDLSWTLHSASAVVWRRPRSRSARSYYSQGTIH